tara:strand:- start:658 stop:765 length:108 start_codon:yes stop_codon:yes gene_type:complete
MQLWMYITRRKQKNKRGEEDVEDVELPDNKYLKDK